MKNLQILLNNKGYNLREDGIIGYKTLAALQSYVKDVIVEKSWIFPDKGFIWIRTNSDLQDKFDDFAVRINNGIVDKVSKATTTPGSFWISNFTNKDGVAVAKPQQVLKSHKFVTAKSWTNLWLKAPYFQQVKPITIYRDKDKNTALDTTKTFVGLFGINFHRGGLGTLIGRWSAGCQVVPDKDWYSMIDIFQNGDLIDYTMFEV